MPVFYNYTENGAVYSFDDVFVPADAFRQGNLWTWGRNNGGQLGDNTTTNRTTPVTTFAGGANWKQVSDNGSNTAAIKTDGTLWTWGSNNFAQLGDNTTTNRSTPVTTFAGGTDWKQVSVGSQHTAAIKTDGTLWGWGYNRKAHLGNNAPSFSTRPTPITTFAGGTNWKQVSCGYEHTAAIKTDGTLWTWGANYGQIGNNTYSLASTPVTTFAGGTDWKQVSCGTHYTSAIKTDGTLWTWGANSESQLGTGDKTSRNTPVTTLAGRTDWKQVSLGYRHTAAIKTDGTLWGWGRNSNVQLGRGPDVHNRLTPVTTFAGGTNWADTATGEADELYTLCCQREGSAAIKTDGTLWTWGRNQYGEMGDNTATQRNTPVTTFAGGTNWKQVSGGESHMSVIKTDGTLWTWGRNTNGQLGDNTSGFGLNRSTPVTTFAGGTNWKQVSNGQYHTAAIKTDGTLWTWGFSSNLRLGRVLDPFHRFTPVTTFAGGTNWADTATGEADELYTLSGGNNFTAAIKTDGTLWTWGFNTNGQLGDNTTTQRNTPVTTFAGGTNWKQIDYGSLCAAAIKTDGTLWTWGSNSFRQLGDNTTTNRSTPVTTFAGGTDWKQVSAGNQHTAALKTDGTLWAWGRNYNGQLGDNTQSTKLIPVTTFAGGTNWKQVSVGSQHTAAIKTDGTLWTWGVNTNGQLGDNTTTQIITPVTTFAGGTNWKQVSCSYHTAAIKTDGTLWTWGRNSYAQLGDNTTVNRSTPVTTFAGGTNWKQVSAGGNNFTAAIKTDGTLWTWGNNSNGRLGINDTINRTTPVTTFAGGTNWKQVSCNGYNTVAINDDGVNKRLYVWGSNNNQALGINWVDETPAPVKIDGGTNWKQVANGPFASGAMAAIKTDGTLWTWGTNSYGKVGTNDTINRTTPVTTFAGGTNWKQVACGQYHVAAIKTDGTLWTWGFNSYGRLGDNTTTTRSTPVTTFAGGTNWKQVSCGESYTAAIKTDGTLWTWGRNHGGQLGDNTITTTNRSTPVTTFAGGTNWKQVFCGYANTIALKNDGTLWVWGFNSYSQAGTNWISADAIPNQTLAEGTNWKQVSCGREHTTAIKTDGTLWGWGLNSYGRLGINDTINRTTPVTTFAGGTNWKQVSAGNQHTVAITYIDDYQ